MEAIYETFTTSLQCKGFIVENVLYGFHNRQDAVYGFQFHCRKSTRTSSFVHRPWRSLNEKGSNIAGQTFEIGFTSNV